MMRLMPGERDFYSIIVAIVVLAIVGCSISLAFVLGGRTARNFRGDLADRTQTIANALDTDEIMQLSGAPADESTQVYGDLKAKLASIKGVNHSARSLYLTGVRDGRLFFYVDSEQPNSRDYSPAGEVYNEATPTFRDIFTTGKPVVEGPVSDHFGTFVSGLAPIFDPTTHTVLAVVGVDISASAYQQDVLLAVLTPCVLGFSLILIILLFEWIRQRNQQLLTVRSELVSVASHELRTPITGIRWAAESLEHFETDERLHRLAHAIYDSALTLQASTDDILELTAVTKSQKMEMSSTDLTELLSGVINTQQLAATQKGVSIVWDPSWPPEIMVKCDATKMKRAMHNVISNAIKYTRSNTTVTLSYASTTKEHILNVTDQGIGIPAGEQAKVFAGFYRASNAKESDIKGTGLGLYLVKAVVEKHKGHVSFVSEENKGTMFTIVLPR